MFSLFLVFSLCIISVTDSVFADTDPSIVPAFTDAICECRCCLDSSLLGFTAGKSTSSSSNNKKRQNNSLSSTTSNSNNNHQLCFPIGISTPGSISNLYHEINSAKSQSQNDKQQEQSEKLDFLLNRAFRKLLSLSWYADPDTLQLSKFKDNLVWLPSCSVNGLMRTSNKIFYDSASKKRNDTRASSSSLPTKSVMRVAVARDRLSRQAKRCLELAAYLSSSNNDNTNTIINDVGTSSSKGSNVASAFDDSVDTHQLFSPSLKRIKSGSDLVSIKKTCSNVQFATRWVPDWISSSSSSKISTSSSIKLKRNPSSPFQTISCAIFVFCICGYIFAAVRTTWFMKK